MNKPLFFIRAVDFHCPKNKLHEKVQQKFSGLLYKTLLDDAALKKFEKYLQSGIDAAHDSYPRSKALEIVKMKSFHNDREYHIYVPSTNGDHYCVMSIIVSVIKGDWEGDLK